MFWAQTSNVGDVIMVNLGLNRNSCRLIPFTEQRSKYFKWYYYVYQQCLVYQSISLILKIASFWLLISHKFALNISLIIITF